MARYRRRSNHWMWQPRDSRGRFGFGSGGGGSEPDPMNEWFLRAAWWKKLLFLAVATAFGLWLFYSGYILVFLICGWVLIWIMRLITAWLQG